MQLEEEADWISAELLRQRTHHGTSRSFTDTDERARTAVRKAIIRALADLDDAHPAAAAYLRPRISTGTSCSFHP